MWLFALLIAVPIIEIALFIQVGGLIGLWPTLMIVVLTAIAGTMLLRQQGLATMQKLQESVHNGQNPMDSIAHGALILVSGVLLLTPGFFTDTVGFLLLVPPVRIALIKAGADRLTARTVTFGQGPARQSRENTGEGAVLDGDYSVLDDETPPDSNRPRSGWSSGPQ